MSPLQIALWLLCVATLVAAGFAIKHWNLK